jgi:hypothetical protein
MLIAAASLAAVLATTATLAPEPAAFGPADALPIAGAAMVVNVTAAADIPRALVTATLHETDAVWRAAGFKFIWERGTTVANATLRVVIGGGVSPEGRTRPLAWIGFDEDRPTSLIYVSHANAQAFMATSRETVGHLDSMTLVQRETYLARAMGRALAHEIGHFLLASRTHASKGLMRATHSSNDFFSTERAGFAIDASERRQMAARFTSIYLASRG